MYVCVVRKCVAESQVYVNVHNHSAHLFLNAILLAYGHASLSAIRSIHWSLSLFQITILRGLISGIFVCS